MTMRMSARAKFFLYLFLIFMVILTVIPLLYTVSASFKTNMEIATGGINLIPKTFTFDNYKTVWSMSGTGIASKVTYTDYTINSIKVSLMTVVLVVLFTSMSAYCFQRGNFPGMNLAVFINDERQCDWHSYGKYLGDLPMGVVRFICGFCENVICRYLRTAGRFGEPA